MKKICYITTISGSLGFLKEQMDYMAENGYEGYMVVEAEQDPAKANPLEYAIRARKFIAENTGL